MPAHQLASEQGISKEVIVIIIDDPTSKPIKPVHTPTQNYITKKRKHDDEQRLGLTSQESQFPASDGTTGNKVGGVQTKRKRVATDQQTANVAKPYKDVSNRFTRMATYTKRHRGRHPNSGTSLTKPVEPNSPKPIFKVPKLDFYLDVSPNTQTPLKENAVSGAPLSLLENEENLKFREDVLRDISDLLGDGRLPPSSSGIPTTASCPMCGEPVDIKFLEGYNNGKRMNIRKQAEFCRAHKKNSARNEWTKKGYPKIDWSDLDARLTDHHPYIKSILNGAPSHYRNILDKQVGTGKDRTLLQAVQNSNTITPGYYGSRGLRAISENIMSKFSPLLRRIAVKDRLVAARGVTGYVQNVLVPELAVRLIGEDMELGVEEARQVMRDSASLGDLLNEEVEDVIIWNREDHVD